MKTDELREKYLEFFTARDHRLCESDVLVPAWDKSVLFTPAGMNPFKDHFLGNVELEFTRATSCQKCLRTGDIENVGRTAYHHTFFEMLGNFSFGDYFKREAINWAWEFLTEKKWLGIDPDRLTVTVYLDDDEAARIWAEDIGLTSDRISRLDEYENFWPAGAPSDGPDGVCGPCSEIFFHPEGIGKGKDVEIWNLVFTQFERQGDPPDNLCPLPSKNIDTGMGLERAASALQGVDTNFHIDTIRPIVEAAAEITGIVYEPDSDSGRFLRRITDHVRACTFAIHENIYPGATKAEYVIRRLLRRCTFEGRQLGHSDPFLFKLVPAVIASMSRPYPELAESESRVQTIIEQEEENFLAALDDGLDRINSLFASMKSRNETTVDGKAAFNLLQTYGIPPELVESMAAEKGCQFDWEGFRTEQDLHAQRSGKLADTVMGSAGPVDEIRNQVKSTEFVGYEHCESEAQIVGLIENDTRLNSLAVGESKTQQVVLDRTPFYAESGGQVADTGKITSPNGVFQVADVQKSGDVFLHSGRVIEGGIAEGDTVTAAVDSRQRQAIARAHTATHILHHALQQTLGSHAQQRGSKVTADWLRFDFSNMEPVPAGQLDSIETMTRARIDEAADVTAETVPLAEAKAAGAMMLFGEKYPDPVRMVSIGGFSKELCGGTHLENSAKVGEFEIMSEESVSSGTRRIVAVTGQQARARREMISESMDRLRELLGVCDSSIERAYDRLVSQCRELKKQISAGKTASTETEPVPDGGILDDRGRRNVIRSLARSMNVAESEVADRVATLNDELVGLQQQLEQLGSVEQIDADQLIAEAVVVGDVSVITRELPLSNPNLMRQLIDQIRKKQPGPVAVFLTTTIGEGKVILVAGVSRDLVEQKILAGDWVKATAPIVGGGGGGKPDLAQAGGKLPEKIPEALAEAITWVRRKLGR